MRMVRLAVVFVLMVCAVFGAQGQSAEDTAAVKALVAAEAAAWNAGDAKAFAARFAEDGSFTNIRGQSMHGHAGFEAQHQRIFTTIYKGSTSNLTVKRLRFVTPDVAVVDVDAIVSGFKELPPGMKPAADGGLHTKLLLVAVKEKDGWWITAFHNVAEMPLPPQS